MSLSTSTLEQIGNNTPDGAVVNSTKIGLYNGAVPVVQAAAITTVTTDTTTTTLVTAINSLIAACKGIGVTL